MEESDTGESRPSDDPVSITDFILDALEQFPLGLSEYELIKFIQAAGHLEFKNIALWDNLSLFNTHFILFHALYKLQSELWETKQLVLEVTPLKIICRDFEPTDESNQELTAHDPLKEYYLDLGNLENTSEEDVTELLTSFWIRLSANEQRDEALKILELSDPVDYTTIKQQYRRLAMQHHPDRGGDHVTLQTLNYAMSIIDKCSD